MTLQARMLLLVTVLVLFAVAATAMPLTLNSRTSMLEETREEAARVAQMVARSAAYSDQAWRDVEGAIGKQMVVQAAISAEFVAAAERAGMSRREINDRLRSITRRTTLDEFWISDPQGHAYLRTMPEIDFTFTPDPRESGRVGEKEWFGLGAPRQAAAFWPLLTGERREVIQRAQVREVDDRVFKYVGVSGVDEPRIVQVGYEARYLAELRRQVGLVRLVEQTASAPGVVAIRVVNRRLGTRVFRGDGEAAAGARLEAPDAAALRTAERRDEPQSFEQDGVLTVAAPIRAEREEGVIGGVLVAFSTAHVYSSLREDLLLAVAVAAAVLALGLVAAVAGARRVARPVGALTAAAMAVEDASYVPGSLDRVAARRDEIGRLAKIFDHMARQVRAREERLQREIKDLSVQIDEGKRRREVAEITETDYFRDLQRRAEELRGRTGGDGS
jgi:adenylate cyclase